MRRFMKDAHLTKRLPHLQFVSSYIHTCDTGHPSRVLLVHISFATEVFQERRDMMRSSSHAVWRCSPETMPPRGTEETLRKWSRSGARGDVGNGSAR